MSIIYQKVNVVIKDVDMGGDVVYRGDHWLRKDALDKLSNKEVGDWILRKYGLDYGNTYKYTITKKDEFREKAEDGGTLGAGSYAKGGGIDDRYEIVTHEEMFGEFYDSQKLPYSEGIKYLNKYKKNKNYKHSCEDGEYFSSIDGHHHVKYKILRKDISKYGHGGEVNFNWDKVSSIFYAQPIDYEIEIDGGRIPFFYLHREAEKLNGFDICNANYDAFYDSLSQGAFLCRIKYTDGQIKNGICFSKWGGSVMQGLVCLIDDIQGIKSALEELSFKTRPLVEEGQKEYLKSIGLYDLLKVDGEYAKGGLIRGWTKDSIYTKEELQESLKDAPIFYIRLYNSWAVNRIDKIINHYGISVDVNKEWHTKGYGQEYLGGDTWGFPFIWVVDVRDSKKPIDLMDDLWRSEREYNKIAISASAENIYETDDDIPDEQKYAKGGGTKRTDLFETPEKMPKKVARIIDRYQEEKGEDMDYEDMANMLKEVKAVGYTFDYGLDNVPMGLRPIGVKINELEGYEEMAKGGMMNKKSTFKEKVSSISKSLLERKKVPKRLEKDYGKTYDKKEAIESAKRIAGSMRKKEMSKKSK